MPEPSIAIVGATGAVGKEFLSILEKRGIGAGPVRLLASARSAGQTVTFRGRECTIEELGNRSFEGIDIALFSAGSGISKQFAAAATNAGAVVVDNSSAFRMDANVPLVIPEVNADAIGADPKIIANPNCSTIILLMAVTPLYRAFGIERMVVSTYQAASGAGAEAMAELESQSADVLAGKSPRPQIFPEPCAFNVFSHNTPVDPATGRNVEEQKMIDETRKIWGDANVGISTTCIRVPVLRAHAESVNITLGQPATEEQVRECLTQAAGVRIVDDREAGSFPTSLKASGIDEILVGRIRPDDSQPSETSGGQTAYDGFELFIAGDQLRKGAALNAVQIAELF